MPIPALALAAAPAAISGIASFFGGRSANKASAKEAQKNRGFQERMRNTQWQATVADMRAAGINPAVAYSKGANASPSGSLAQQKDAITPAVSSAMQMKRMTSELQLMREQTRKAQGEADSSQARGELDQFRTRWMKMIPGEGTQPYLEMLRNEVGQSGAQLGRTVEATRKDRLQGDVLEPMAEIARELGVALPVLLMMMKGLPGGVALGSRMIKKGRSAALIRRIDARRKKR